MRRKTKIIATIGPAVNSPDGIRALIDEGMDVARLNFSHGTLEDHATRFGWIRDVADDAGVPLAIMQDVQGPKIRVGTFPGGSVELEARARVVLEPGEGEGSAHRLCIAHLNAVALEPGARILLADGLISLEVERLDGEDVIAVVEHGGVLHDHKGAAFPGSAISLPVVTERDGEHLAFGMELGFDLFAVSFVSASEDLRDARKFVGDVPLIAKIESAVGYEHLDDILTEADGVMVARGDLGVELSLESVPRAQTDILRRTNAAAKVSITATEMLESMTANPRPTRAEVTDVYRSVLEGTDAVMLSAETAIGDYPARAVRAMNIICREAESSPEFGRAPEVHLLEDSSAFASATAQASVDTADRLGLDTIVAFTESGSTARLLSKYRARADVYAFTPLETTYRRMAIYGGIIPKSFERVESTDEMIVSAERHLIRDGIVEPGDGVVMVAGIPPNQRASTNIMKLHEVGTISSGLPGHSAGDE